MRAGIKAAGKDGTEFLILKLWPELAAVAVCFHKESMLLITDGHMNTWKIDFIKVTNILCAKFFFFTFRHILCCYFLNMEEIRLSKAFHLDQRRHYFRR